MSEEGEAPAEEPPPIEEEMAPEAPVPEEPLPAEEPPAAVQEVLLAAAEEPPPAQEPPPAEEQPLLEEVEEVQVAEHMPTPMPTPSAKQGKVRRESTVSNIPITESSVLNQLKEADQQARNTMILINSMKRVIGEYQDKPHMTEEDTRVLEEKQMELLIKLSEFEAITRKMQKLVGLSGSSLVDFKPSEVAQPKPGKVPKKGELEGKPEPVEGVGDKAVQTRETDFYPQPEDMLPKVVVCGFANQVPRILICEAGNKSKPKPKLCQKFKQNKNRPQMQPPPPITNGKTAQCFCIQEQLRAKDNTIECLKSKMNALQSEMQRAVKENCHLTVELEKATQKQASQPECPTNCVPQCIANYPAKPSPPKAICPSNCPPQCVSNYPSQYTEQEAECPSKCPPQCVANNIFDTVQPTKCRPNLDAVCLQSQLNIIELEVQKMREDLVRAQQEQQKLDGQRDLLKCAAPKCLTISSANNLSPCACSPPPQYTGCRSMPQQ